MSWWSGSTRVAVKPQPNYDPIAAQVGYVADCPGCGRPAQWRGTLIQRFSLTGAKLAQHVEHEVDCSC